MFLSLTTNRAYKFRCSPYVSNTLSPRGPSFLGCAFLTPQRLALPFGLSAYEAPFVFRVSVPHGTASSVVFLTTLSTTK
jgi:hypothetical protein